MKEVTLDLVSDKETEGMVGTYLPLAVFPQSNVMLVADKKDIYQLDETGITEFKGLAKINPTGFATAPEGKLLLVKSEADGKGIKNAVFFYTTGGQRQDLELPNGLAYSKLAGKKVRAICAASPDGKWLIVERREDVSKLPMLQADLVLQATPKLSAEYERRYSQFAMLSEKGKYRHGYELVERSTGRSRDIAVELAPPGLGPNAEATWSPDGAYVALGLELQQGRQGLWLMDTQSGSVAKLVDYTPPPAASK
jgi:hypothetical protein